MFARWFLPAALVFQLPAAVSSLHPRIYIRHDAAKIGAGLTVSALRGRAHNPAYARWRQAVPENAHGALLERAARYLEDGGAGDLAAVRDFLSSRTFSYEKNDVGGFLAAAEMAAAFDWVYQGLDPRERAAAMANIVTTTDSSARFLRRGQPDINHNYTYMALSAVSVCGLALHGEAAPYGAKADEYLELARGFIEDRGRILDTWQAREGVWAEGSHYSFHETLRTLVLALHAYRSATDTDYFPRIRLRHGDFIRGAGRFVMGSTRPDMTFERTGDSSASRVTASPTVPLTVEMLAAGVGDADEAARLRSYNDALLAAYGDKALYAGWHWGMRVFWDPRARRVPSYRSLPWFQRLGAGTVEQIVWRNASGPAGTQVTVIAGDHYTDHQHFDKGQFLIYHRGGLAIDSGAYDQMYKPERHSNEYAPRTLAHNCLLVFDEAQPLPKGYGNDGGQSIIRGKQHHGDWPLYLAHRESEGLHAAEVQTYDTAEREYAYLEVDLAKAYGARLDSYRRSFVYLPGSDWLLVLDRVTAARPEFQKRWLLHFQERPIVDGRAPEPGVQHFADAVTVAARRRGTLQLGGPPVEYDGALFVDALLPERRTITTVGGPGYEYFNLFSGLNYPVSNAAAAAEIREPGAWRMEVAPAAASREDVFLHAIEIRDGGAARDPVRLIRVAENRGHGAHLLRRNRNEAVVFGTGGLPLQYTLETDAPTSHLVTGLPPLHRLSVVANGKTIARVAANSRGVLRFQDTGSGRRSVEIRER